MFRTRFGYFFYTLIAIITVILTYDSIRPAAKVEAQSLQRFQINKSDEKQVDVCDTKIGTLISITDNEGYKIRITPDKCMKNPR